MSGTSILFVVWDGGGNVTQVLGLANRMLRRGHRVRVLTHPRLEPVVRGAGCEFRPLHEGDYHLEAGKSFEEDLSGGASLVLPGSDRDFIGEVGRDRPALAVVDAMYANVLCSAEASRVPYAALVHTLPQPFLEGGLGDGFALATRFINQLREDWGLGPLPGRRLFLEELWAKADCAIVTSLPELDLPFAEPRPWLRYVGPALPDYEPWDWDLPWSVDAPEQLVVVALTTTVMHHEAVAHRVVDALGQLGVHGLVTLGSGLDASEFAQLPPNVTARAWVPHHVLFPNAAAVVTHAGHSTVMAAAVAGVPMVCVPLGRDQPATADRVEALGAGVRLAPDASVAEIACAVQAVLDDPGYRAAARRLRTAAQGFGYGQAAVDVLEGQLLEHVGQE